MNLVLYFLVVLIWGTTWIAIKFQVGVVPVENSILYRFMIASFLIFMFLIVTKKLKPLTKTDHLYCVLQGAFLFCLNFYALYKATSYIESGLVSVIFSMSTVFNVINNWFCYQKLPDTKTLIGSLIGFFGILLIFSPDIMSSNFDKDRLIGIALATLGTYFFSCGNIVTVRHKSSGLPVSTTNAWGMFYGVLILLLINAISVGTFDIDTSPKYLLSLLFLAVPGSVVVFAAYLGLIGRIGPHRAAYATILFPIIALSISYFLEGYRASNLAVMGFCLAIIGNIVVFYTPLRFKKGGVAQ